MKTWIRDQVFESNSSSSHAVVISAQDILDQDFDAMELRSGTIVVRPRDSGYADQQFRYNSPYGKLAYLLVLAAGGHIFIGGSHFAYEGEEIDVLPLLLNHDGIDYSDLGGLVRFIKEETGCDIKFVMDQDTADSIMMDEEILNLTPMLEEKFTLRRLLKSSRSWIDVGRDDGRPFSRYIRSDLGEQVRQQHAYVIRELEQKFEIYFTDKRVRYLDSMGRAIEGVISGTNAMNFLTGQIHVDAHICGLQVGRDDEEICAIPDEVVHDVTQGYHDLVHYIFEENARPDIRDDVFNLTISSAITPEIRGIRRAMSFNKSFFGQAGFRLSVQCNDKTLETIHKWYDKKIVRTS
jgi:hypothetical protein